MAVREVIKSAFANVPYPGDDNITHCTWQGCPECEDITARFRGTTWQSHVTTDLQQYQSALSLFTVQALHYFLPAYMLASLGAWAEADNIPFSILQICLPPEIDKDAAARQYWQERFSVFTHPQREAIAAYLQEYAKSDFVLGEDDIPTAIELLYSSHRD